MRTASSRRGFTLVELAAVIGTTGVLGAAAVVVGSGQPESALGAARASARQLKDSTQLRAISQALIVWAQNNNDLYPLPSVIDKGDLTVKEQGRAKDASANIMSLLVFCGALSTETLVSPVEKNPSVVVKKDYAFDQPKTAVNPAMATWDPALSAELGPVKGNISYANLQPFAERQKRWSNTFVSSEVVLTTRGPEIRSVTKNEDGMVTPHLAKPDSFTLRLFGDGKAWSGNAAFNDNHVDFATDKMADGRKMGDNEPKYAAKDAKEWPDIWCYDEPDDEHLANNYIGLFVKAGEKGGDWKGAWD